MSDSRFVLRNLPGVAELEARLQRIEDHPNPHWAPELDGLAGTVDRLSDRLFGITDDDTDYKWDEDLSEEENNSAFDEWERHFEAYCATADEDEAVVAAGRIIWDAMRSEE